MSYGHEEERLRQLIDDGVTDEPLSADSDSEVDLESLSNHDSDTEQDCEEESAQEESTEGTVYLGKDKKTKWQKHKLGSRIRTRAHNIINQCQGVLGNAKNAKTVLNCWELFFPDSIQNLILKNTNDEIERKRVNYDINNITGKTDMCELRAVFGLLYLAGFCKSNHQNLEDLWATDGTGIELFRSTMSLARFRFLLRCLRFDDRSSRITRRSFDKLAPIRELFDKFNELCTSLYSLGEYVTIDEKLEAFRGRCSFRQYIPSKPAKYGLKIFALVDAQSYYTTKLEVYVGTQPEGPYRVPNTPSEIVTRMIALISGSNRNVTLDNWFTSYQLAKSLLHDHKLTMVGTMRKNKRELPFEFVNTRKRNPLTTIFGFQPNITIASFVPKKNKNVIMISTLHYDDKIDEKTSKPEIITFYNEKKGGVDVVYEMCSLYNVNRPSRRWPMTLFFSLLNVGGINAYIIYKNNNSSSIRRRDFLKELSKQLVTPQIRKRSSNPRLPVSLRNNVKRLADTLGPSTSATEPPQERQHTKGRCEICPRKRDRKTNYCCQKCSKHVCLDHIIPMCPDCVNECSESD